MQTGRISPLCRNFGAYGNRLGVGGSSGSRKEQLLKAKQMQAVNDHELTSAATQGANTIVSAVPSLRAEFFPPKKPAGSAAKASCCLQVKHGLTR